MTCRVERHASPLGRWLLARARPASLAPFVDQIWYFEGRIGQLRERHFPDGRLQIIVHLGPLYRRVEDGRAGDTFPRLCLAGLQLRSDVIEAPPEPSRVLGMILRPAGAYRLLAHPLDELTNRNVDLGDLTRAFREQIGVPPKALARMLRFRSALERLNREEGPLVEIALASGYYDQPHFNAEFLSFSGFTPTEYLARRRYPESVNLAESAG